MPNQQIVLPAEILARGGAEKPVRGTFLQRTGFLLAGCVGGLMFYRDFLAPREMASFYACSAGLSPVPMPTRQGRSRKLRHPYTRRYSRAPLRNLSVSPALRNSFIRSGQYVDHYYNNPASHIRRTEMTAQLVERRTYQSQPGRDTIYLLAKAKRSLRKPSSRHPLIASGAAAGSGTEEALGRNGRSI